MGAHTIRRRVVATAAGGTAVALIALLSAPQAVTAEPLLGAAGMQSAALGGGIGSAYLELDGITPTPATATDHSQDIAVRSLAWKISRSVSAASGTTQGASAIDEFTVVKPLDSATPLLLADVDTNKSIKSVNVFLVRSKPNGTQLEALQYSLRNAVLVDDEESTDGNGTETLKFVAQRYDVTYFSGTTAGNLVSIDRLVPSTN